MYNADKPITKHEDDLLDRSDFSHQLANAIVKLSSTDTFVVGLYGEWGSGKTSVLNLTEEILRKKQGDDNSTKIKIIRFNPWGYTDGGQLVGQFFSVLASEFKYDKKDNSLEKVGATLENYAFALEFAKYIPVVGTFLTPFPLQTLAEKFGKTIKDRATSRKYDVLLQKEKVVDALKNSKIKVVIIIDDLDRLPNEQIRMIFQLVNSVANFPNTTYVLSFDKNIIVRALKDVQNCIGEDYLKKIIQFPISLPEISGNSLLEILRIEINKVFKGTNQDLFEKEHWNYVLLKCVYPFIRSIRDLRRYINTLSFKYLPLKNNINPSDFAGITALEVFERQIFDWVIRNQAILTTEINDDPLFSSSTKEVRKEDWYNTHKEKCLSSPEIVLEAIVVLFPMYAARFDTPYESLDSNEFSRLLRICSNQRFEKYFTLSLGNDLLSRETRRESYNLFDHQELSSYFNDLIKAELAEQYLLETLISTNEIPEERNRLFIDVLFENLGAFSKQEKNKSTKNPYSLCLSLLLKLLVSIHDENARLSILQVLIERSSEINFFASAQLIHHMEAALGRFGSKRSRGDKIVFNIESIESIEQCFISRINTLPDQSSILRSEHLKFIDYLWRNIDALERSKVMHQLLINPENLLHYTANKASRILDVFSELVYWGFDVNTDFTEVTTVSKVLEIIESSDFLQVLNALSTSEVTNIAAFYLYTQCSNSEQMENIPDNDAKKLASTWLGN